MPDSGIVVEIPNFRVHAGPPYLAGRNLPIYILSEEESHSHDLLPFSLPDETLIHRCAEEWTRIGRFSQTAKASPSLRRSVIPISTFLGSSVTQTCALAHNNSYFFNISSLRVFIAKPFSYLSVLHLCTYLPLFR